MLRSQVAPAHCCAEAPSEPDVRLIDASGSSKPLGLAGGAGFPDHCLPGLVSWQAIDVQETVIGSIVCSETTSGRVGDELAFHRLLDCREPLFPVLRRLWLVVGVEKEVPADRTTGLLGLQKPQAHLVQRWGLLSPPVGPVLGQRRVIE